MAKDVYSLQLHWSVGNQPGLNVLHFQDQTEGPNPDPDSGAAKLIEGWQATIESALGQCIPESVLQVGMKARRVNNGGGPSIIKYAAGPGGRTGGFSSGAIGPCIIWGYQKLAGGWRAGRTFLPGVSEADIESNVFVPGLLANIDAFIALMLETPTITVATGWDFDFGIYSPTHSTFSGAESGGVSGKPGVQNGRMKPTL